jgi:site-specific recombinase XerD
VRALRGFSAWLEREGYTKTPLFDLLDLPKLPQKKIDVLSPEQIQKIMNSIQPNSFNGARLCAMMLLFLDSGIRASELIGLKLSEVDWNRGVFKVFGKGSKERFVPLGSTAKQALLRYVQVFRPKPARDDVDNLSLSLDGYPLTVNALTHIMRRLGRNAGVPRLHVTSPQDLYHFLC